MAGIDLSCICLSHGRTWLLREIVECFRRQRMGGATSELLIVDDCSSVEYVCDVPGVRILKLDRWMWDMGEKTNVALAEARGRYFALTDDDDLFMPMFAADALRHAGGLLGYRPGLCWKLGVGGLESEPIRPLLNGGIFDREHAIRGGGVATREWNDVALWRHFRSTGEVNQFAPSPRKMRTIYRWDGKEWHHSGEPGEPDRARAELFRAKVLQDRRFISGRVALCPGWERDYEAMVAGAVARKTNQTREAE